MTDCIVKSGDEGTVFRVRLADGAVTANLTGATVVFTMRPLNGGPVTATGNATIVGDPLDGVVQYVWQVGDLDIIGEFIAEWEVTYAGGAQQTYPTNGYTTIEVMPALDTNMSDTGLPALPDNCWPVDLGCCGDFDSYSLSVQVRAKALAVQTMRALTAYRIGGCPVTVRPCSRTCVSNYPNWFYNGSTFMPISLAGVWVNMVCGCGTGDCGCTTLPEVVLPAPVGRIDSVILDGVTLNPSAYRVDGNRLVRLDGGLWPVCQDMALPSGVGTFLVTYLNAYPVDGLGAYAAGVLACEFASACNGGSCRLPSGVTHITRQGITMDIASGSFPGGLTGIREVDAYIMRWNPNGLRQEPTVWSPDMARTIRRLS